MKIVGIVGMLNFPGSQDRLWKHLTEAFGTEFPSARFAIEHALYLPWQGRRIRAYAARILETYDDGSDVLLVGYSLGGVIACAIAPRFKRSRIIGIATIAAPHRFPFFYETLGIAGPQPLPFPVRTFAGRLDLLVPAPLARYPGAAHMSFAFDHLIWLLVSPQPARLIARTMKTVLGF